MSDQIRSARLALDQAASELDRAAFRREQLPTARMTALATKIRDAMTVLAPLPPT